MELFRKNPKTMGKILQKTLQNQGTMEKKWRKIPGSFKTVYLLYFHVIIVLFSASAINWLTNNIFQVCFSDENVYFNVWHLISGVFSLFLATSKLVRCSVPLCSIWQVQQIVNIYRNTIWLWLFPIHLDIGALIVFPPDMEAWN